MEWRAASGWRVVALWVGICACRADGGKGGWPEFRGPTGQGHAAADADPPLKWSPTLHVRYKTEIPGVGWSSPAVEENRIWMSTATEDGRSLRAVCVDAESGRILHDIEVFRVESPRRINAFNSYASPSPVIEGGRVYVCFGGEGSACLDAATGMAVWKNRDLRVEHMEGAGSSPVIYKGLYLLHFDGVDAQFVAALDKSDGKLVWKRDRDTPFPPLVIGPFRKAFSTPLIVNVGGKDQLVSPAARRIYSYDPENGREVWHVDLDPPAYNTAPRPVYADGVVYVCTGFDQAQLLAIKLDETCVGDVTRTHVLWKFNKGVPHKPSPLLVNGELYIVGDNGIARCLDPKTGEEIWHERVGAAFSASPVDARGRIYFFGEGGRCVVVQAGREFKVLADNFLEAGCLASPAFVGNCIYIRTKSHLFCVQG